MSDSGLKLPATTELEWRVREALKVARMHLHGSQEALTRGPTFAMHSGSVARAGLAAIIRILEDGRS